MIAKKFIRNKSFLVVIIAGTFFLAAAGFYALSTHHAYSDEEVSNAALVPLEDVQAAALQYSESGDIDGGLAFFDQQLGWRKSSADKRQLLIYKTYFAIQAKKYETALTSAKQADRIKSDYSTVLALAKVYDGKGDKPHAIVYYQKAVEISPSEGLQSQNKNVLKRRISELQS